PALVAADPARRAQTTLPRASRVPVGRLRIGGIRDERPLRNLTGFARAAPRSIHNMARPSVVIAALLVAASPNTVGAEPTRVTFEQALGLAEQLPELVVMRSVAAAERTLALPRPWQPLTLSFTPQLRLRPRASRGPEGGIAVQQAVPLADIDGARRQVLERQADARTTRAAAAHLEARLAIARAWIAAWVAREQRVVAEREYELARAIVD